MVNYPSIRHPLPPTSEGEKSQYLVCVRDKLDIICNSTFKGLILRQQWMSWLAHSCKHQQANVLSSGLGWQFISIDSGYPGTYGSLTNFSTRLTALCKCADNAESSISMWKTISGLAIALASNLHEFKMSRFNVKFRVNIIPHSQRTPSPCETQDPPP